MQFSIPQFIEMEDKIFGPLSLKQFIYVIGGAGGAFVAYSFLPFYISIFFILIIGTLAFLLAFKPVGGRPFSVVLEAAIKYLFGNKLYLWRKEKTKDTKTKTIALESEKNKQTGSDAPRIPVVEEGKLDNLSWNLDVSKKENTIEDSVPKHHG